MEATAYPRTEIHGTASLMCFSSMPAYNDSPSDPLSCTVTSCCESPEQHESYIEMLLQLSQLPELNLAACRMWRACRR